MHGVGAGLPQDLNGDDVFTGTTFAKEGRPGAQLGRAVFDLRHVADAHRRAAARADDDFAELLGGSDAPEGAQAQFLRAGNHAAAGRFDIFACEGVAHIKHREVVRGQFLRVEQNANLALLPAVELDAADAVDRLDRAAHLLVGNFRQFAAAERAAHQQRS